MGGQMAARRRGGIVAMTSMSAFQGSPFVTVYAATKAFLLNLAEGVGRELAPRGRRWTGWDGRPSWYRAG
jgi:short-subunit dehydrogenase